MNMSFLDTDTFQVLNLYYYIFGHFEAFRERAVQAKILKDASIDWCSSKYQMRQFLGFLARTTLLRAVLCSYDIIYAYRGKRLIFFFLNTLSHIRISYIDTLFACFGSFTFRYLGGDPRPQEWRASTTTV